jgi:hypothetical protein
MTAGEAAFEFLRSPDGRAMVTRALRSRGLPLDLRDDLVGEIMRRVLTAAARETIENPPGFATHAAQYAAADLLRGELRRPVPLLPTAPDDDAAVEVADDAEPADARVVARAALQTLREALFDNAYAGPTQVATALAYLAASVEDAPVGSQCPAPLGGAGEREADEWAGLWYGGKHDCFGGAAVHDGPAVRKRRSRAIAQMRAALVDAAGRTELVDGDD